MWKGLEEFTKYTKSQRRAIYLILCLIVLIQVVLYFSDDIFPVEKVEIALSPEVAAYFENEDIEAQSEVPVELFSFNPNTASADDLKNLGMSPSSAERLINYRNKGGQFYKATDLYKLYGIDSNWVEKVIGYVVIPKNDQELKSESSFNKPVLNLSPFDPNVVSVTELTTMGVVEWQARRIITYREKVNSFKAPEDFYKLYGFDSATVKEFLPFIKIEKVAVVEKEIVPVEINTVDSVALVALKGIGKYTAKNILKYRDRLGGFVSVDQLGEVYGLKPDRLEQILPYFKVDASKVKKLNINTASFKELLRHPYLEYEMVKSIVNFRENTRAFKSLNEIKNLEGMNDKVFEKVKLYLKI